MNPIFLVSLCGATALLLFAFSTNGKEGMAFFFFGAVWLLCTLAVGLLRWGTPNPPSTNKFAIVGAVIGLLFGGVIGANCGFGRVVIAVFNPELMEQDFGMTLGAIGGGILGAFVLAFLFGIVQLLAVRKKQSSTQEIQCDQT